MRVDLFDFNLPPERIATAPVHPRDAAKLLHVSETLRDRIVADLPSLLSPNDVLVFNDSRVIPARLFAEVNSKQVEILLHQPVGAEREAREALPRRGRVGVGADYWQRLAQTQPPSASPLRGERFASRCIRSEQATSSVSDNNRWYVFARPAKKLKKGMVLTFAEDFSATVLGRSEDGAQVIVEFPCDAATLHKKLRAHGHVPLPPYIARGDVAQDHVDYQTIYAARDGSVAAPTAGLHFTNDLMRALDALGIRKAFVTLHVGAGTFQPVKVEDTDAHVMHREPIEISQAACDTINAARAAGGKVVAVGTTSLRILESIASDAGVLAPFVGDTGIFITPGYRFKIVDKLMTNFHLPKSTLFMLVSAFVGLERMKAAYAHAIASDYRFYSYGDASLLERAP